MVEQRSLRRRASGVLLHLTSLPGGHGIGDLGPAAYRFIEFLAAGGQSWWQTLPVTPPDRFGSPYQSESAFAGSPLLISLERLVKARLLKTGEVVPTKPLPAHRVDYAAVARFKSPRLRQAFDRFEHQRSRAERRRFHAFCEQNRGWLDDYALFCALKQAHAGASWTVWAPELRRRQRAALARAGERLRPELRYCQFVQYVFWRQWSELRRGCDAKRIGLIGDLPIFVAHESADVWAHQALFKLDRQGQPTVVAGVPPDYFSRTGQLWGNPVYRWDRLRARNYDWWIDRLRVRFERFDALRLDHFIGFHRTWEVPTRARSALQGRYVAGPGAHFFDVVLRRLGPLQLIAEDLGVVTPEVTALRDRFGFPGIRVLQFAFGDDPEAEAYRPHRYPQRCVVYTGTHDNDTTVGWFRDIGSPASTRTRDSIKRERAVTLRYLGSRGRQIHWDMIRLALMSVADLAMIPAQDLLGLGSRARMNLPGTTRGSWRWRLPNGGLTGALAHRLRLLTETSGRVAGRDS